ncbi:MAG: hypothetical protein KGJ90_05605, partial [Patescibacteria group bacterium]|nr:hypothetical protein [Patescibacteria group bacterium]
SVFWYSGGQMILEKSWSLIGTKVPAAKWIIAIDYEDRQNSFELSPTARSTAREQTAFAESLAVNLFSL